MSTTGPNSWQKLCNLVERPVKQERFNWNTVDVLLPQVLDVYRAICNEPLPDPKSDFYFPVVAVRTVKQLLRAKGLNFCVIVPGFTKFCSACLQIMGACVQDDGVGVEVALAREYAHMLRFVVVESSKKMDEAPKDLYEKYKQLSSNYGIDMAKGVREFLQEVTPPTAALLKSAEARKIVRGDAQLREKSLGLKFQKETNMMYQLANILDEEITVLYPGASKGWHVDIAGISTNTQFYALITNAIQQADSEIKGPRIPARAVKIFSGEGPQQVPDLFYIYSCTMANWTILDQNIKYPLDYQRASHWLYDDGIPAEISQYKGRRVVVIDKTKIPKRMDVVRIFPRINAHAKVTKTMTKAEVDKLVAEIKNVNYEERDQITQSRSWIYQTESENV